MTKLPIGTKVTITDGQSGYKGLQGTVIRHADHWDYCVELEDNCTELFDAWEVSAVPKVRGFQCVTGCNVPLPQRKTRHSAGYDIASTIDITIVPNATVTIPTGIKVYMADDEFLGLYIRSSMGKLGLSMATGVSVIDSDYYGNAENEGHIFVILRNDSSFNIDITKGQRLVQGIFQRYLVANDDNVSAERQGGTGSTGK